MMIMMPNAVVTDIPVQDATAAAVSGYGGECAGCAAGHAAGHAAGYCAVKSIN